VKVGGPVKVVLFDFGGVLAEEGFRNGLLTLAREQQLDENSMPVEGMRAVYDSGFVLGRATASDFWALLRKRTGLAGNDEVLTERILDGFVVRPWMMELVVNLKHRGYMTGILSDQTHWLDILDQRYHFYQHFDHIFNSYYLGKGKQDITLFADVAALLHIPPTEILFVDDDNANVTRARSCHYQVIIYIDEAQFIAELEKVLS
jgi:putative hydrolase of the HAD superfamily